jgi:mannonate dehydratase
VYAHADGSDLKAVEDSVRRYMEEGFRYVRAQMGGYGGGGFDPPVKGQRVEGGYTGPAFDEDVYVKTITEMFEHLRNRLGWNVKLLHDVHEHLNPNVAVEFAQAAGTLSAFLPGRRPASRAD